MGKKMTKVYIIKSVLSKGIIESGEGEIREDGYFSLTSDAESKKDALISPKDYVASVEEAKKYADELIDSKIKKLKKLIKKLESTNLKLVSDI